MCDVYFCSRNTQDTVRQQAGGDLPGEKKYSSEESVALGSFMGNSPMWIQVVFHTVAAWANNPPERNRSTAQKLEALFTGTSLSEQGSPEA